MTRCDIAIAGGGMVGLSLAAALAELPLDVVVIEPVAPDAGDQPSFDARTTALSAGSRRVLEGIGVWPAVAAEATPIRRIHVSERGVFGFARPDRGGAGRRLARLHDRESPAGPALCANAVPASRRLTLCPPRVRDTGSRARIRCAS